MAALDFISELKQMYGDGVPYRELEEHLTEANVVRWSTLHGWSRSQFFEEVAKFLAHGFNNSELSFEFCDAIVNDLFGPYIDTSLPKSELFWDVYLAFDDGEYYHGVNRDKDPVEVYTRPLIAGIVEVLESFYGSPLRGSLE